MPTSLEIFEKYRSALVSRPLSAVWRGHGSAIFLEFGRLSPRVRRDGAAGKSRGELTVVIEWIWRIEGEDEILCGSWSEEQVWEEVLKSLVGRRIEDVSLFGRLPELSIALAGGLFVASSMTADGQPQWTIFDHRSELQMSRWIEVRDGGVCENLETKNTPAELAPIPKSPES
ncbi:hypothetical protein ACWKW9_19185 [Rhizobium daejeonense]